MLLNEIEGAHLRAAPQLPLSRQNFIGLTRRNRYARVVGVRNLRERDPPRSGVSLPSTSKAL
jgi:hypothetical protein